MNSRLGVAYMNRRSEVAYMNRRSEVSYNRRPSPFDVSGDHNFSQNRYHPLVRGDQ